MPGLLNQKREMMGLLGETLRGMVDRAAGGVGLLANAAAHPGDTARFFRHELTSFPTMDPERDRKYLEGLLRSSLGGQASGDSAMDAAMGFAPGPMAMAGTFMGKGAKTFNQEMAARAQKMKGEGADDADIWRKTMTWLGKDGPVQEIDDSGALLKQPTKFDPFRGEYKPELLSGDHKTVQDILSHDNLFSSYPDVKNIPLNIGWMRGGVGSLEDNGISLLDALGYGDQGKETLLHEIQHFIQNQEDWARGGNVTTSPSASWLDSVDKYSKLTGEAQARATQARMNMGMAERQARPPWESYDVPLEDLIYRYGGGEVRR